MKTFLLSLMISIIALLLYSTAIAQNTFPSTGNVGIGTTSPNYQLQVVGDIYANSGWLRVGGDRGLYFENYGGGFHMTESNWIRTCGNKNFYHNTGIMRTDGVLHVGSSGDRFLVNQNGNVGIGTTNPTYKLQVAGEIYANGGWLRVGGERGLYFENYGGGFHMIESDWIRTFGNKNFYHNTGIMRTDGVFHVGPNGNRFLIAQNGGVGIATTTIPSGYKLAVNGKIIATEVRIKPYNTWPDYVFAKDYKLKSLEEVATYIQTEKHLPGVPSAQEIAEEGGFEVGQMTQILLEKVEEMTLYMIDMKEENEALKERVKELEQQ